ncbi:unnamed protein product [Caretta caretta]
MDSTAATSKENLHAALETLGQTEKMIAPLPIPRKSSTAAWTAAAPWSAHWGTASKKTLSTSRTSQMSSIDWKSSVSLKKICGDAAAGKSCTSRTAFQDITARTNIILPALQEKDARRRTSPTSSTAQDPDVGHCPAVLEATPTGETSETIQQDLNISLDACPVEPSNENHPENPLI